MLTMATAFAATCCLVAAPAPALAADSQLSAVWANEGGDKVWREELRASSGQKVQNSVWDGNRIHIAGARNEVLSFVVLLESTAGAKGVSATFTDLAGPGGTHIGTSTKASGEQLWRYVDRNIEGFYLRYLKITGINRSNFGYESYYDERHIPARMRRPLTAPGSREATGDWHSRPMADKSVPDIAVPLELQASFDIPASTNQGLWFDVYVPASAPPGDYTGTVSIKEQGVETHQLPVTLHVYSFTLPNQPAAKTMVYTEMGDSLSRYAGTTYAGNSDSRTTRAAHILDNQFRLFKRHKISLVDKNCDTSDICPETQPAQHWRTKLDGSFYSRANGYDGPGVNTPDNIFAIGPYGSWRGAGVNSQASMQKYLGSWDSWFRGNAPGVERFLYLLDESSEYELMNKYLDWMKSPDGSDHHVIPAMITMPLPRALSKLPRTDIVASNYGVASTGTYADAYRQFVTGSGKKLWQYNGTRPASGSFLTEDDGVATRMMPWAAYKMGVDRWFYWESTYYNDYQANHGLHTDVFANAVTYGQDGNADARYGHVGYLRNNGDGVLVYPGSDARFPDHSYNVDGPFASVRLKNWRRGVQDIDYVVAAQKVNPDATRKLIQSLVPKVLWETGVQDESDPTYQYTDISWPTDPTTWESARSALAAIIEGAKVPTAPVVVSVE